MDEVYNSCESNERHEQHKRKKSRKKYKKEKKSRKSWDEPKTCPSQDEMFGPIEKPKNEISLNLRKIKYKKSKDKRLYHKNGVETTGMDKDISVYDCSAEKASFGVGVESFKASKSMWDTPEKGMEQNFVNEDEGSKLSGNKCNKGFMHLQSSEKNANRKSKKKQHPTGLSWQPPLEFEDELDSVVCNDPLDVDEKMSAKDVDDSDSILSSAIWTAADKPVKTIKSKDELRKKIQLLGKSAVNDTSFVSNTRSNTTGFGIMPKYETADHSIKDVAVKKDFSPVMQSNIIKDVGIWSDEESHTVKLNSSQSVCSLQTFNTDQTKPDLRETVVPLDASYCAKNIIEKKKKKESDIDASNLCDYELPVHGPMSLPKKTFVFKINMPKPESQTTVKVPKAKKIKRNKKKSKKHHTKSVCTLNSNSASVNVSAKVATVANESNSSVSNVAVHSNNYTSNSVHSSSASRIITHYNPLPPYYTPHPPYMPHRGISLPCMYTHTPSFHSQFVRYPTKMHMPMGFNPPLPKEIEPPPLPTDREPERPPEPPYDFIRLSDVRMAAMFAAKDINEKNLQQFFDSNSDNVSLPSPASSHSSSILYKKVDRRDHRKTHSRYRSSSFSSYDSLVSSRSHRQVSSSHSRYQRRKRSSRYSSSEYSRSSRSRTPSSSISSHTVSKERSTSSFSSSSRLSSYASSSGSDLDRPCRHYRHERLRPEKRSSATSYDGYTSCSTNASRNAKDRGYSRRYSRNRSLSATPSLYSSDENE